MNRDEMVKRIRVDASPANNGSVLTCINPLNRSGFSPLEQVRVGVKNWGMEKPEFIDSIYSLKLAGYIETCTIKGYIFGADLANCNYDELETRVSEKGIRLMRGSPTDECARV